MIKVLIFSANFTAKDGDLDVVGEEVFRGEEFLALFHQTVNNEYLYVCSLNCGEACLDQLLGYHIFFEVHLELFISSST